MGVLEGLIIFILSHYFFIKGNSDGGTNDFYSIGSTIILAGVIVIANLKVLLDMSFYDYFSIFIIILSILLYFISIVIFSNDWLLPKDIVLQFYILDNFKNVILDLKFLCYIIVVCSFCSFLEIFADKTPIMFGIEIEGKYLLPYKRKRNNKKNNLYLKDKDN